MSTSSASDDPSIVDNRSIHAVGGVGSAETYGLSGTGEASHTHPARLGHHHLPQHPQQQAEAEADAAAATSERHSAGAASFAGQQRCECERNGACTCKGVCTCQSCTGQHTEEQLMGEKGQPEHPRPAVTGI